LHESEKPRSIGAQAPRHATLRPPIAVGSLTRWQYRDVSRRYGAKRRRFAA
jgi:hypothetical protein